MPDTYTSQFSGEEIDSALRAAQIISGASTPAELRDKLEIRGDTIPVSATDPTPVSEALTASGGGVNPNLLDNWFFGRPVNQRGDTDGDKTDWKYFIDRWLGFGHSLKYTDNGITVNVKSGSSYSSIMQRYSKSLMNLVGKTVTLSCIVDGELHSATATVPSTAGTFLTVPFTSGRFEMWNASDNGDVNGVQFYFDTSSRTILAAKLELGDQQTLAHKENGAWVLNEIPDYGEQLRRCLYYAEKVETNDTPAITNSTLVPSGATSAVFILPYARKRTVPAINFNDVSNYRIIARSISGGTTAFSATAISILDVGRTKAAILVSFNATDQDFYCFLQRSDNAPAGYAFISADL